MAGLKVYVDFICAPSRAVLLFLKRNNITFETKLISLREGEHKAPNYMANVHSFGQVPAIDENGFKVIESVAILRYLARKYDTPDHWYPQDLVKQAKVDEYLEWQHIGKIPMAKYFYGRFLQPILTGKPADESSLQRYKANMEVELNKFESIWLKDKPYLTGNEISVADLLGLCDLDQARLAGFNPSAGRPILEAWMNRVRQDLSPHYEEVTAVIEKIIKKRNM